MTSLKSPRPHLRLVWSRPEPAAARIRIDLARAIEGHLAGDGLTDAQFARLFATGQPLGASAGR